MGCFSVQCGITDTLIDGGEDMVMMFVTRDIGHNGSTFVSPPIKGKYNDYGKLHCYDDNDASTRSCQITFPAMYGDKLEVVTGQFNEGRGIKRSQPETKWSKHIDMAQEMSWEDILIHSYHQQSIDKMEMFINWENPRHPRLAEIQDSHVPGSYYSVNQVYMFRMHRYAYDALMNLSPLHKYLDRSVIKEILISFYEKVSSVLEHEESSFELQSDEFMIKSMWNERMGFDPDPDFLTFFSRRGDHLHPVLATLSNELCDSFIKWMGDGFKADSEFCEPTLDLAYTMVETRIFEHALRQQNIGLHPEARHASGQHSTAEDSLAKIAYLKSIIAKEEQRMMESWDDYSYDDIREMMLSPPWFADRIPKWAASDDFKVLLENYIIHHKILTELAESDLPE